MTAAPEEAPPPGGAAVGRLLDLPPLERQVIVYLRLWSEGHAGQCEVWADLAARLGPERAGRTLRGFEELLALALGHARRPLVRHARGCPCAGADECVFARFVALAAEGAREDAILMASLMVRPDFAVLLHGLAAELGLGLMAGQLPPAAAEPAAAGRVH